MLSANSPPPLPPSGTHLTAPIVGMDRVPLSFKTKFAHGTVHRHIVLAVRYAGKWGALGISRRFVRGQGGEARACGVHVLRHSTGRNPP